MQPIEKNVLLLGAGNAHLGFVKRFGMQPLGGVAVTLVSEYPVIPYSAMTPAHLAGDYTWDEVTIDLVRLCASMKVRFLAARAIQIEPRAQRVHFPDRPPLSYDVLSLGLGSLAVCPPSLLGAPNSIIMRPMGPFVNRIAALDDELRRQPRPFHLVVVGGGASGCELTLALHRRLAKHTGLRLTLLQSNARLLPNFPERAATLVQREFTARGIEARIGTRVTDSSDGSLVLEDGSRLPFDAVVWATHAAPPDVLRAAGLSLNPSGFLQVRDTLQSVTDDAVFGTGDCVSFVSRPDLPKTGVYAVRQGRVLFDNVAAYLRERPLTPFRPQPLYLSLLNTADGEAVFRYGPLVLKSRWARRLKDRIDRNWIDKFKPVGPLAVPLEAGAEDWQMRCGGCGSKISGDVLSAVLKRLDVPDDPRILMGCRAGEDAAVHRVRPEAFSADPGNLVEVQTIDFFKSFVDDPFLFGRLAALHAVSDIHAMNARPFTALAMATLPYARGPVQEAMLFELLSGALRTFRELGVVLTGGHTTEGAELALGFAVTGHGEEGRLFQKGNLQPGDQLILTKSVGSGALLAAWMRGACRAEWFEPLTAGMLQANAPAAAIFARAGVTACTDITGFGLAGHLLEMLDASKLSAEVQAERVPLYAGFREVAQTGILSSLQRDNAKVGCRVHGQAIPPPSLFDPQTSGGLLAGVKAEQVATTLAELRAVGFTAAAVIGSVVPSDPDTVPLIQLR
ncbi:MAG: selenide, water dikinase SelD [Planctomycetia bacterium]|nr:selenide, water dikinase SelD [Planctomycetia bacterium]